MTAAYFAHKVRLRGSDVRQGLAWNGQPRKGHKISGVTAVDGGTHLAFILEAADARESEQPRLLVQ